MTYISIYYIVIPHSEFSPPLLRLPFGPLRMRGGGVKKPNYPCPFGPRAASHARRDYPLLRIPLRPFGPRVCSACPEGLFPPRLCIIRTYSTSPPGTISYLLLYLLCMPPPLLLRLPFGPLRMPEGGGRREKRSLTRVFPTPLSFSSGPGAPPALLALRTPHATYERGQGRKAKIK
jgi:hypothetical protein